MKTRPIIFNGHDVRAIREGRKTQTRMAIKPQPPEKPLPNCHPNNSVKHPAPYLDSYCSKLKMLKPNELAAAQGFPKGYKFSGNTTEQVRQIGNAVPCGFARALLTAQLSQQSAIQFAA